MGRNIYKYSIYVLGGFGRNLIGYAGTQRQAKEIARNEHDLFGHTVAVWDRIHQRRVYKLMAVPFPKTRSKAKRPMKTDKLPGGISYV